MVDENSSLPERSDERPWPDAIRAQLNRILVQAHFVGADDQVRLLRHLIELSTQNQLDNTNENNIALSLFNSGKSEAEALSHLHQTYQELRNALMSYFGSRGRNDPVIFELPEQSIGLAIKASDVQLELADIEADSNSSAILPQNRPINLHAITAMGVMAIAGAIYFFGIDKLTTGPTGPESITDVGPLNQKLSSIVIQPFTNKDAENINDHYPKELTIELAARLSREHALRIISPDSTFALPLKAITPGEIAKIVDVRYVLTGEFVQNNDQNDLLVKLINAGDDEIVWQKSYQHKPENISSLYANISKSITATLASKQTSTTNKQNRERVEDQIKVQPAAYATYLKARSALVTGTPDSLAHSITLFQSAIKEDPDLPRAHSGLAASLVRLAGHGVERIPPKQAITAAHKAAVRALRLNEYFPEPYTYLGTYRTIIEWNWKSAERVFVYAIQFNPSYAEARLQYSQFLESQGRHRDAIDQAERAHTLNPLSPRTHANRAWQYLQAEWFTRARKHFNNIRKTYPKHWAGPWGLGHYYWRRDDLDEAIEMFQSANKIAPENTFIKASLGHLYGLTKQSDKAHNIISTIKSISQSRYVSPLHFAMIYAGLGELDKAFSWLEKAFAKRAHGLAWLNVTKEFHPLHNDPRFDALLKRLKLNRLLHKRRPQP